MMNEVAAAYFQRHFGESFQEALALKEKVVIQLNDEAARFAAESGRKCAELATKPSYSKELEEMAGHFQRLVSENLAPYRADKLVIHWHKVPEITQSHIQIYSYTANPNTVEVRQFGNHQRVQDSSSSLQKLATVRALAKEAADLFTNMILELYLPKKSRSVYPPAEITAHALKPNIKPVASTVDDKLHFGYSFKFAAHID